MRISAKLTILLLPLISAPLSAEVSLPAIFSDHMVLQSEARVPVWGWAEPGEEVSVEIAGQTHRVTAGTTGKWQVWLQPLRMSRSPIEMRVSGHNELVVREILVGEVWLASGQSNMQFSLGATDTAAFELSQADHPEIRLFNVSRVSATEPQSDVTGSWQQCRASSAAGFSAVAYFFGREINRRLRVPVGLIAAAWGGTNVEEWMPWDALEGREEFRPILQRWEGTRSDVRELFREGPELVLDLDDVVFVPGNPQESEWLLDNFSDGDMRTSLFGSWSGVKPPRGSVEIFEDPATGESFVRLKGPAVVGHDLRLEVKYGPGRSIDLSRFRGARFRARGTGHLRFHSIQPTVTDSDNFATAPVELTPDWKTVEVEFGDLRQAGWGKRQPFTTEALQGVSLELMPLEVAVTRPPAGLFNGMVHPLLPYAVRGALWYQGEGNAGRAFQYRQLLPALVESWRQAWGRPDLWFLVVQLPNFRARQAEPSESDWAELREAQLMARRAIPNTGLAVTIDLGEPDDVHPRSKVEVGRRLSLAALGTTYGLDVSPSGPLFLRSRIEGDRVRIWFDHSSSGLVAAGGDPLRGFSIAGADRKFRWARARLEGDTVVVWSEEIGSPMAVRYGWADNPDGNLYSRDGLPASPFRTDDWPGLTNNRR